jgi:Prealbumin-like fold domain
MRKLSSLPIFLALALFSSVTLAEAQRTPKPETGLEGVISEGPIRGGPSRQGAPNSSPLANVEFLVAKENSTAASFKTDDQGRFRISLPSGHYTISRKDWKAKLGSYSFEVDVIAGQMKRVQWNCDTGLR